MQIIISQIIILLSHFLCPILFTHILFYHSDISIQFYSIVPYSTLVGLTEATIGSILVISVLLNMLEVHDSGNALKNPEPWLGYYRWQRFWIDGGPLRKEKWFTFPVFIITTLPAFNEPAFPTHVNHHAFPTQTRFNSSHYGSSRGRGFSEWSRRPARSKGSWTIYQSAF